jgi:hypothetical protein
VAPQRQAEGPRIRTRAITVPGPSAASLLATEAWSLADAGAEPGRAASPHASLTLAHTLLITLGYAASAHASFVSQATTLVLTYPDMLKATGFLLLGATGIISARAVRRRLSYETWHYLHFATYLAVFRDCCTNR